MDEYKHCSFCGHELPDTSIPRTCSACSQITWGNPKPVVLIVQPVGSSVLVIRRGIEPHKGELALPGGYMDYGEDWQTAAVRELYEETGVTQHAADVSLIDVASVANHRYVVICARLPRMNYESVPEFVPNSEVTELQFQHSPVQLAVPLHTKMLKIGLEQV